MWRSPRFFWYALERLVTLFILAAIFVSQLTFLEFMVWPRIALAVPVAIDTSVSTNANSFFFGGSQTVFISDQVGYRFYRDAAGSCSYSKTTNGGSSWGIAVTIDAQTDCASIAVWYDQWTPNDFGTNIHIVTMDENPDELWYNRLDTASDTRLMGTAPVNITSTNQGGTFTAGVNAVTITKSTGGDLYVGVSDASDSFVISCLSSSNCGTLGGWYEPGGTRFMDLDNDWNILLPLTTGSILLINRDISANTLRSRVWDGSSWSASWLNIDTNAVESATYDVSMAAVLDPNSGDVYLAYGADHDNYTTLDHDVRTAKYSSGSWTGTTAVFTNRAARGLHNVAIALDTNTSTVYVGYVLRTTPATATTGNVYYATSTSAMSSWGLEQGPVNTVAADIRGLDFNILSDERIYASWVDPGTDPDELYGEVVADIAPVTKVYANGSPTATVTGGTNNLYLGGSFAIRESVTSRNVTDIVLTERGTVAADTAIANVKLFYDLDTSAPYDCVSESYSGTETQYGLTDANGFSGTDGTSAFSGLVSISPTQSLCIYPVVDLLEAALDGSTVSVSIESPNTDVLVSGGSTVMPAGPVRFLTSSLVQNDELTQTHFHWRNDNGSEAAATSATGGVADTALAAILPNTPRRLRVQVSNEGVLSSAATNFRLEYAEASPTCDVASGWTDVGATNDAWNMSDSTFLTDGSNTTNIAVGSGGMVDENTTFLAANGGVRDTSSQTGSLTLTNANFVELEYSVVASTSASEGTTYCFRVTAGGTPLPIYSLYPSATVAADVAVSSRGTQTASMLVPSTNQNVGAQFVLRENTSGRNITSIMIAENGTADGVADIDNIRLLYDLDTSAPYDCASETYAGTESQFGSTDSDGFSTDNGTSTFSGSVAVTTTATMCVYVVLDITAVAQNNDTVQIEISSPANDVVVSSGSVSPSTPIAMAGTTTLAGAVMTQSAFHWRDDNGTEAGATSATGGAENVTLTEHTALTPIRLRMALSNEGAAVSTARTYRLEFGPRVTTCDAVSVWTPVGDNSDDWDMFDSTNLTNGNNTTNIAVANGGVTDPNTTFLVANAGVRDTTSTTSALTLATTEFAELEFSITSTNITAFDTTYCFRLTDSGVALPAYANYATLTTAPRRDFKVQRGVATIAATSQTLTAGVDYTAPASSSLAFVRITDTHNTGAGRTTAGGGAQNADDVTAYISNSTNIGTNFTIGRPSTATGNTRVTWEMVEFIGQLGTDNDMRVRAVGTTSLASGATAATGTAVSNISDDTDVVVFVTGVQNRNIARNLYYAGQVSSSWDAASNQPVITRGVGGAIIDVSYAVVEFTGINWQVQRLEHTYSAAGAVETESITTPLNSLSRAFIHTQKRMGALGNVNNYGHEVWLSSIGAVSFRLEAAATTPASHTSVVWIIENLQTSTGAMAVQRTNGTTNAGTEPVTLSISIFTPIDATNNASIFANTRVVGANTTFPLVFAGARITGTSTYELWRSEASGEMTYRTEIVEWPVSGLAVRQNYYRIYTDNNALTPTDPWPAGPTDLGENNPITVLDEPLGEGERMRLRMTLRVANANLPAGLYDFKLQAGLRTSSCASVGSWVDVDAAGGSGVWRGYAATGTTNGASLSSNPPSGGDLLISVSDRAGSLVEEGSSPANPYLVDPGEDVEYDWIVEQNGAISRSTYCFRVVRSDGTPIDGYFNYPQVRTAGYSPQTKNWRFYDDETNETQTVPMAAEVVSPIEVQNQNISALRITVGERKNVTGQNVKFKLQYDEDATFSSPRDVVATSTCTATSTWCYAEGLAADNATITTKVLSDADACSAGSGDGCGTHNTSPVYVGGFTHGSGDNKEFVFYVRHAAARAGAVYYFRLYEVLEDVPVPAASGEVYPSLVAETPKLTLNVIGLGAGTTTAGITTTATATPNAIAFGSLMIGTDAVAAHRINLTSNATDGYRVYMYARQQLLNDYGTPIPSISSTNAVPAAWSSGCSIVATGCVGYHTTDATLGGGSTRFAALDSYAGLHTNLAEVMYSPIPSNDVHDIVYRVRVYETQPAATYRTEIVYIAVPSY
jgi:hypothetical protein